MIDTSWGSATCHQRVMATASNRRRKCRRCEESDQRHAATHVGTANGVALMSGCEWSVRRWVADQDQAKLTRYRATGRQ